MKEKPAQRGRLRIIAGVWRGRMIATLPDLTVRPTSDRAREALFNRLAHGFTEDGFDLNGATVVDLCAGSGALGLEALSRGAAQATFIDQSPPALALIRENIATLGAEDRATVISAAAQALPRASRPCDLALIDPPYDQGLATPILASLAAQGWLRPGAVVSVETGAHEAFDVPAGYALRDRREYGRAAITFLLAGAPSA